MQTSAARARGTLARLPSASLLVLTRTFISAFLQLITKRRRPVNPISDSRSPSLLFYFLADLTSQSTDRCEEGAGGLA